MRPMTDEQLEYAISQYVDGTLPPLEREALEQRLAADPYARGLLDDYRRLEQRLQSLPPLPEVKWDRLASHLSAVVAEQELPVRHYALHWRMAAGLAAAASLFLALSFGIRAYLAAPESPVLDTYTFVQVQGPWQDIALGPVVQEVSVGPSRGVSEATWHDMDALLTRPARVIIASAREPSQEVDRMPY